MNFAASEPAGKRSCRAEYNTVDEHSLDQNKKRNLTIPIIEAEKNKKSDFHSPASTYAHPAPSKMVNRMSAADACPAPKKSVIRAMGKELLSSDLESELQYAKSEEEPTVQVGTSVLCDSLSDGDEKRKRITTLHHKVLFDNALERLEIAGALDPAIKKRILELHQTRSSLELIITLKELLTPYVDDTIYKPDPTLYPDVLPSPFRPAIWLAFADECIQEEEKKYIYEGMTQGFELGCVDVGKARRARNPVNINAGARAAVQKTIDEDNECHELTRVTSVNEEAFRYRVISPIFAINKKELGVILEDKWRRIFHLSHRVRMKYHRHARHLPSINDGIPEHLGKCSYTSVADIVQMLIEAEELLHMGKVDVKKAYRIMPVKSKDYHLLCLEWEGVVYADTRLVFGLRSACAMFERLASTIEVIARDVLGIALIRHYLDDFIIMTPSARLCLAEVEALKALFALFGMTVSEEKCTKEPKTDIIFLGLELDSAKQCVRIPQLRMDAIITKLTDWQTKSTCTCAELASLIGVLMHASAAVAGAKLFTRRLVNTLWGLTGNTDKNKPLAYTHFVANRTINLTSEFQRDIDWWLQASQKMNGVDFPFFAKIRPSDMLSFSCDASDVGYAGVFKNQWFAFTYTNKEAKRYLICYRELYAILVSLQLFGSHFTGKYVRVHCDNTTAIMGVRKWSSRRNDLMFLLRQLHLLMIKFKCYIYIDYISSKDNYLADLLSRDKFNEFFRRLPSACRSPILHSASDLPSHYTNDEQ